MKLSSALGISAGLTFAHGCDSRSEEIPSPHTAKEYRSINVVYPTPLIVSKQVAQQIAASFLEASNPTDLIDPTSLCQFIGETGMTREKMDAREVSRNTYKIFGTTECHLYDVSDENPFGTNLTLSCIYNHGDADKAHEELLGFSTMQYQVQNLSAVEVTEVQPANPDGEWHRFVTDRTMPTFSLIRYAGGGIAVSLTGAESGNSWEVDNVHDYIALPDNQNDYQKNLTRLRDGLEDARLDCADNFAE